MPTCGLEGIVTSRQKYLRKAFRVSNLVDGIPGITAVRFLMAHGGPEIQPVVHEGELSTLNSLASMLKDRFEPDTPPYLNERRQLRLYREKDLFILKPSEVRYWTLTASLNDADIILADHWTWGGDAVSNA